MTQEHDTDQRLRRLVEWYGDGSTGAAPTPTQWHRLLDHPSDAPITLLNFFKIADVARGPDGAPAGAEPGSGQAAFARYSSVSVPTLERVGGRFLLLGQAGGELVGDEDDWDVIAVGSYPNPAAALALFEDPEYRAAYPYRVAACERQKVVICTA